MTSTPDRYAGPSGTRRPSPWSVRTRKSRPARPAAAATSSIDPAPSERFVWTWNAPEIVLRCGCRITGPGPAAGGGKAAMLATITAAAAAQRHVPVGIIESPMIQLILLTRVRGDAETQRNLVIHGASGPFDWSACCAGRPRRGRDRESKPQ